MSSKLLISRIIEIRNDSKTKFLDYLNLFNDSYLPILETRLTIGFPIYRARHTEPSKTLNQVKEFSYNEYQKSFSRIGTPDDIWFYASDHYHACLAEMLPYWFKGYNLGSQIRISVGEWQIREPINVLVIPDVELKNNMAKHLASRFPFSERDIDIWQAIGHYFYQSSYNQPEIYMLSSALIKSLLIRTRLEGSQIGGITYPSIQLREQTNIALLSNIVDEEKIIFKQAHDMIFEKGNAEINGKPHYSGPITPRIGVHLMSNDSIEWRNA